MHIGNCFLVFCPHHIRQGRASQCFGMSLIVTLQKFQPQRQNICFWGVQQHCGGLLTLRMDKRRRMRLSRLGHPPPCQNQDEREHNHDRDLFENGRLHNAVFVSRQWLEMNGFNVHFHGTGAVSVFFLLRKRYCRVVSQNQDFSICRKINDD